MKATTSDRKPSSCARLSGLVTLLVLLAAGSGATAQSPGPPVVVADAREIAADESIRLPGTVVATRVSRLSTAIGGLVKVIAFDLGDRIEAGDTIVELDDSLARHALDQASAAVEEAQAAAAEKARLYNLGQNLTRRGVITKDQLDTRAAEMRMARAVVRRLRADEAAQAELLQRHRIVAPFAGVVASRDTEVGEWVAPGANIVELVADREVAGEVTLPQEFVASVQTGVSITLSFDALGGRRFPAGQIALSPSGDVRTRSFRLRIAPQSDDLGIAPGMSAQAFIAFATEKSVIAIPRDALVRQPDGRAIVWIVGETGESPVVSAREVIPGRAEGDSIRITSGLQAGEKVVVRGNESLQAGQPVRIVGHGS